MPENAFDQSPIFQFLDAHVPDRRLASRTMETVTPVLRGAVVRNFTFERLRFSDLEPLRLALQELVGFAVREVRAIALDPLFAAREGEEEAARASRIGAETDAIEEAHVDMDEVLGIFDPYLELRVPEETQAALAAALDAAFKDVDPQHEDPLYLETIEGMAETFVYVPMLALAAAAIGDEVMYGRAAGFMPWLARCLPIGALRAESDVFTVVTTHALS